MATLLLASQVPSPQVPTDQLGYAAANSSMGGNAPSLPSFKQGDTSTVPGALNKLATAIALTSRYGGGCFAVVYGLALSIGAGLNVNVALGQAFIDGPVEIAAATHLCPNNTSRVHLWLKQDGTLTHTITTIAPDSRSVYIGSCVTNAGAVTSVDTSGVVYLRGGVPWRQTADPFLPSDNPSGRLTLISQSINGAYLWNGSTWNALASGALPGAIPQWFKFTVGYADLNTAASNVDKILMVLPAGSYIHDVKLKHSQSFTGGTVSAATISLGITGTIAKFLAAFNVFQAPGDAVLSTANTHSFESHVATENLIVHAIVTGDTLDHLTQGSVDVWVLASVTS